MREALKRCDAGRAEAKYHLHKGVKGILEQTPLLSARKHKPVVERYENLNWDELQRQTIASKGRIQEIKAGNNSWFVSFSSRDYKLVTRSYENPTRGKVEGMSPKYT